MNTAELIRDYTLLPAEARKEVADFVAFLKSRYSSMQALGESAATDLSEEPFIGMWREREDLVNSTDWVCKLRDSEWS